MAAILARSTTASAVVSARRSQAEQPCVRRSVSAAAWQKAITEADLEKADVSNSVGGALFLLSFFRKIKTAVSLFGNRNWENKALGLIDAKDRIECAARRSGPRAKISTPRSKKLSLSLLAIFLSQPRPATFPSSLHHPIRGPSLLDTSFATLSEGLVDADRRAEGRLPVAKLGGLERTMATATLEFCLRSTRRFFYELVHLLCHGLTSRFPLLWFLWKFLAARSADRSFSKAHRRPLELLVLIIEAVMSRGPLRKAPIFLEVYPVTYRAGSGQ